MTRLQGFSDAATPVMEDLGEAAPSLTDATRTLTPFSEATTVALKSLGEAGEASGPFFAEADPIVRKTTELSKSGVVPTRELAKLTTDLQKTEGWDSLVELIYNTSLATNGFDQYGHYGRTNISLADCIEYISSPKGKSGCVARFNGPESASSSSAGTSALIEQLLRLRDGATGGTSAPTGGGPTTGLGQADETEEEPDVGSASATEGTEPLLDYLLGP
jgi:hypothetical protein